eukprot:Nitzschia sp. Nitz4//scaffold50_size126154//1220//1798//NITZ4_003665-RA/size126154-processed-gene-0.132-mRNA-1//1//CDS//3329553638//5785//frame0
MSTKNSNQTTKSLRFNEKCRAKIFFKSKQAPSITWYTPKELNAIRQSARSEAKFLHGESQLRSRSFDDPLFEGMCSRGLEYDVYQSKNRVLRGLVNGTVLQYQYNSLGSDDVDNDTEMLAKMYKNLSDQFQQEAVRRAALYHQSEGEDRQEFYIPKSIQVSKFTTTTARFGLVQPHMALTVPTRRVSATQVV